LLSYSNLVSATHHMINTFQYTIETMNFLQRTLHDVKTNSVWSPDQHDHIKKLLTYYPNRIIYDKPYTHIFSLKTRTLAEYQNIIDKHAERGTHMMLLTEMHIDTREEWHKEIKSMVTVYEHQTIAQRQGIKWIRTLCRVDTGYKNVSHTGAMKGFWPQDKS
jgi:hypothetical protein